MSSSFTVAKWLRLIAILLVSLLLVACTAHNNDTELTPEIPILPQAEMPSAATGLPTGPVLERPLENKPFSLIDGRLSIQAPMGTVDNAVSGDIMSAQRYSRQQTRLILEVNGQKIVVFAQETFQYSENIVTDIRKILRSAYGESYSYELTRIRESSDFDVVKFAPVTIDTSKDAVLVRGAYARVADGTLISVGVYVTPEMAANKELCIKQADRILATLQPGTRRINTEAHEETIDFVGTFFSVYLQNGYALYVSPGSDFIVAYLIKLTKPGEALSYTGIYIGGHPSALYLQYDISDSEITKTQDSILNTTVKWYSFEYKEHLIKETGFALPDHKYGFQIHIFMKVANEAELNQFMAIVKTLKAK